MGSFIEFSHVRKQYQMGEQTVRAVDDASFNIEKGEFCVIVGPSGSGKSTILNLLGGMDSITGGSIIVDGNRISDYKEKKLTLYRRHDVGFVFQFYNLIPNFTAIENVELASHIATTHMDARKILNEVGLSGRLNSFPSQLSGGEQQRVVIARALVKNPKLLLCDEPIGALDYTTGKSILKLLQNTCRLSGMTVVVVTHNQTLTAMSNRVIKVKSGAIAEIQLNQVPSSVEDIEW
jgi:putative ABC transport system ATP-binding protein